MSWRCVACRLFWQEIADYQGNDPLEVWMRCAKFPTRRTVWGQPHCTTTIVRVGCLAARRFIKWTQDTFASGGHQAELIPLLERCTRELQDLPQYKDDPRYLRVWIQYVSGLGPAHWCAVLLKGRSDTLLPMYACGAEV